MHDEWRWGEGLGVDSVLELNVYVKIPAAGVPIGVPIGVSLICGPNDA